MVRQNMFGGFEFSDDAPIKCDCGCMVNPGDDYQIHNFDVTNAAGTTTRIKRITCDNCGCCESNIFFEVLTHNRQVHYAGYNEAHCNTAAEEKNAYADEKADDYEGY